MDHPVLGTSGGSKGLVKPFRGGFEVSKYVVTHAKVQPNWTNRFQDETVIFQLVCRVWKH